jgi:hypothetical protein
MLLFLRLLPHVDSCIAVQQAVAQEDGHETSSVDLSTAII